MNVILENEHVLLRPLTRDDYVLLLPYSLNEPGLWYYSPVGAAGKDALQHYIEIALSDYHQGKSLPFIVIDKKTGEIAGSTRYYNISPHNQNLEIGFTWYGKKYQGTGLNKSCKFLLLEHAFNTLHCLRVGFRADATNIVSIAAMKSIGATPEGILRQDTKMPDGRFRDTIVLSILQSEWENHLREELFTKIVSL